MIFKGGLKKKRNNIIQCNFEYKFRQYVMI